MADRTTRRVRLDTPLTPRRGVPRPHYDPDAFGRVSEQVARFLGTARFLVYLTALCVFWLAWNSLLPKTVQFDPRSMNFTLLTLILSLQASYAAPLILLAQNRQADRDRLTMDEDRATSARLQADVDYLTRELAALRQTLGEVASRDFLREQLRELSESLATVTDPEAVAAAARREERERRAERKKRKAAQASGELTPVPNLGEPFVGDDEPD